MTGRTTLQVRDETWEKLDDRKDRGETFDDVINQLIAHQEAEA